MEGELAALAKLILGLAQVLALQHSDPEGALAFLDSIALERLDEIPTMLEPLLANPRVHIRLFRAELLLRSGRHQEAFDVLTEVQDVALTDDEFVDRFLGLQGRAAVALDNLDLLQDVLARSVERYPSIKPFADFMRVAILMLDGDLAGVLTAFQPLEDPEDATNPLAWVVAAVARQHAERADVEEALDRAIELDSNLDASAYQIVQPVRARAAVSRGDIEAVDAYGAQVITPEERILYHNLRAAALWTAGRLAEAIDELKALEAEACRATSKTSRDLRARALASKAGLLLLQDDIAGAEQAVKEAQDIVDTLPPDGIAAVVTSIAQGVLHMKRGKPGKPTAH